MGHESEVMKVWRDFAMADPEDCDREWDACLALVNRKETASGSPPTISTLPLHHRAPSAAVTAPSTANMTAPLRIPSGAPSSDYFLEPPPRTTTTPIASASPNITKDDLSPEARRIYDYLVGASTVLPPHTEVEDVHDEVDDRATPTPDTYSAECPSHDLSVSVSALIPSATPNSSPTTTSVVPELATPVGGFDPNTGREDPVAMFLIPWSATTPQARLDVLELFTLSLSTCSTICVGGHKSVTSTPLSPAVVPASSASKPAPPVIVSAVFMDLAVGDLITGDDELSSLPPTYVAVVDPVATNKVMTTTLLSAKSFTLLKQFGVVSRHTGIKRPPWPPPWSTVERIKGKPESSLCCFSSQGDRTLWRTVEIQWKATLTAFIFALGVQCEQLQPEVSDGTDLFCHDTHSLIASTTLDRIQDFLLPMRATCTLWTWCYVDNLHCSSGSTTLAIPDWQMIISSLQTWMIMNCDFSTVHFQWAIRRQQSARSGAFLIILNGREEVQQHYTCLRVLLVAHRDLQINPSYSVLMQCSFSHSQLQSEFRFYTAGHVLFFCCALVQWKGSLTISLIPLQFWFQYCSAGHESRLGCEKFQWTLTITWFLSYRFFLSSIQTQSTCVVLLVHQNYPTIYKEPLFRVIVMALVELCSSCDVPDHGYKWLMLWSATANKAITLQFLYILSEMITYFGPKEPTSWNYAVIQSCPIFCSNDTLNSCWKEWSSLLLVLKLSCLHIRCWNWWSSLLLVYVYLNLELGGATHIVSTLCPDHCLVLNGGSSILVPVVQAWERGLQFTEPILWHDIFLLMCQEELQHFQFGGVNFLYLHRVVPRRVTVTCVRGNKFLEASSVRASKVNGGGYGLCLVLTDDPLHTILDSLTYENCSDELKKYWDPGGVELQFSETAFLIWLVTPWDPGGYAWRRLEVKPNFKERGLSATSLLGRHLGLACPEDTKRPLHIRRRDGTSGLAWNRTDWTAASAEGLAWPACCVCFLFFVLRSTSSSPMSSGFQSL